jgi:hypothetical protein
MWITDLSKIFAEKLKGQPTTPTLFQKKFGESTNPTHSRNTINPNSQNTIRFN